MHFLIGKKAYLQEQQHHTSPHHTTPHRTSPCLTSHTSQHNTQGLKVPKNLNRVPIYPKPQTDFDYIFPSATNRPREHICFRETLSKTDEFLGLLSCPSKPVIQSQILGLLVNQNNFKLSQSFWRN